MSIIEVSNKQEFDANVTNATGTVLVKFTAPWCGPCKSMKPIDQQIDEAGDVPVVYVNIDEDELNVIAKANGVRGVPTYTSYTDGVRGDKSEVGANSKATIEAIYK